MRYRIAVLVSLLASLLTVGCIKLPLKTPAKAPQPLPERYAKQLPSFASLPKVTEVSFLTGEKEFRSIFFKIESFALRWGTNKILELECFVPYGASNAPTMLLLPVSGGKSYPLERGFLAPYFAKRGYVVILARREKVRNPMDPRELDPIIVQSVVDNRRVLDWIATRPECDTNRIVGLGTSLGSMKLGLLMACDSRVKAGVMALTGCDAPYIMTHSKDGAFRGGGVTMRRNKYLAAKNLTHAEFFKEMQEHITWDTKYLGECVDPQKTLLILGSCDFVVPFKKGLELRRVMGKPETDIFLGGHYSSVFYIFYIRHSALEFIERKLGEK